MDKQLYALASDGSIRSEDEMDAGRLVGPGLAVEQLVEANASLEDVEKGMLTQALARSSGNRSAAARPLGLSRAQSNSRLAQLG